MNELKKYIYLILHNVYILILCLFTCLSIYLCNDPIGISAETIINIWFFGVMYIFIFTFSAILTTKIL